MTPRERILQDRPFPALLRLAMPNIAASTIQSLMLVTEGWYIGGLGPTALAGIALVFPLFMLTMMLSAGAIGGAVSGAMARAIGAGDTARANAVLRVAVVIALVLGTLKALVMVVFGRAIFQALGGDGPVLLAALDYARVLFPAIVLLWVTNMIASALRGTGDMIRPAVGVIIVVAVHFLLIAGQRALGAPLGVMGAAWAVLGGYLAGLAFILAVLARPGQAVRLTLSGWRRLEGGLRILGAGMLAGSQSLLTIAYSLIATAVFGRLGQDWLAGYGIGTRLELLLIPIVFGIGGASMVATGTLLGAGRRPEAIRMGWIAAVTSAAIIGGIGLILSIFPVLWSGLFTDDPAIRATAAAYLERVGPVYAFFGLGLSLYFASQGLETLLIPVIGAVVRIATVIAGFAALAMAAALGPDAALIVIALSMVLYGASIAVGLWLGPWSAKRRI